MKQEKTLLPTSVKWPASVRPLKPSRFALIMLGVLCFVSCRTIRNSMGAEQTDSLSVSVTAAIEQTSVVEASKPDTATTQLSLDQIRDLPVGAAYTAQAEHAQASLSKRPDGALDLSVRGTTPPKVQTTTKAKADADIEADRKEKPPEPSVKPRLKDDRKEAKWWPGGIIIGCILFAILFFTFIFMSVTRQTKN